MQCVSRGRLKTSVGYPTQHERSSSHARFQMDSPSVLTLLNRYSGGSANILLGNERRSAAQMTNIPSDAPSPFQRKSMRSSIEVDAIANAAGATLGLHDEEQGFELPGRLFEQLPFAVYVCDRDGLVLRYNRRAAELWGRSPKLGDPDERFCGSYRMFRPDGSLLPHHQCPMADVLRTGISVRNRKSTSSDLTARAASHSLTSSQSRIAAETLSAPSTAFRI